MKKTPLPKKPISAQGSAKLPHLPRFVESVESRDGHILIAAFHCIAEVGIAATTTRAVARRAGINQGSIHYYFSSKDELLLAVLKALLQNSINNMRAIRDSGVSPREKLDCLLAVTERFIQGREEVIVRVALWAHIIAKGGIWQQVYRKLFEDFRSALIAIIDEGVAAGVFQHSDTRAAAEIIITAIFGIGMQYTMDASYFTKAGIGSRLTEFYQSVLGIEQGTQKGRSSSG